ncbi:MAG: PIN domain-containing protein [Mycobacteriales bacterium]
MILVDTNVLVALTDADDYHHGRCKAWLSRVHDRLLLPATVLAEACYLIDRQLGPSVEAAFLDDVGFVRTIPTS